MKLTASVTASIEDEIDLFAADDHAPTSTPGDRSASLDHDQSVSTFGRSYSALLPLIAIGAVLTAFLVIQAWPFVTLRADLLMWEESSFVSDIIKLRSGVPLYTNPSDNNSMVYPPAAQLTTYLIARLFGISSSVRGLRIIQVFFALVASLIAVSSAWRIRKIVAPEATLQLKPLWSVAGFLALFLVATAPEANKYVLALHVDAFALVVSMATFWVLLRYIDGQRLLWLVILGLMPALCFFTKQQIASWAGVSFVTLLVLDRKRIGRLLLFAGIAATGIGAVVSISILIWGSNFEFWVFEVVGRKRTSLTLSPWSYELSLTRSLDHVLQLWPSIAVGLIGSWLLLKQRHGKRIGPIFAGWIVLIAAEAFSSGTMWNVLYHFGPAVLIGAAFLLAALPLYSNTQFASVVDSLRPGFRPMATLVMWILLLSSGFYMFGVVPTGDMNAPRSLHSLFQSRDVERYVSEIEREFAGLPADKVLLDAGSWMYVGSNVVQRDRAASLGDQPVIGKFENMDAFVGRIRNQTYSKILVHDFNSPYFQYDWSGWPRSSGVRHALLDYYDEVRVIAPPRANETLQRGFFYCGPVSVFVAKARK